MRDSKQYLENRYIKKWGYAKRAMDLLGGKCKDCGETHPAVLSFHHLRDKDKLISRLIGQTTDWEIIKKEVVKCELVCENCHRKLHFNIERFENNYDAICKVANGDFGRRCQRWTEEESNNLKQLFFDGKHIDEIAVEMNRDPAIIRRNVKKLGLRRKSPKRKDRIEITESLRQQVIEQHTNGLSVLEISKNTSISIRVIYRMLAENRKQG